MPSRSDLCAAGFAVDRSHERRAADGALATEHFDLLVVDVGLPGRMGCRWCAACAVAGATQPVLILTARDTLAIKVEALNLGADDFLLKPFEQDELIARCRALIRRANLYAGEQVNLGRLRLDVAGRMLRIDETVVDLTGREWLVLECLAFAAGRVVSKERLQQADRQLRPGAHAERRGSLCFTRARQARRRRRHPHRPWPGIPLG